MMTDPCFSIVTATCPVIAGHVLASRIGCSVCLCASEDVMPVGRITAARYCSAALVDRSKGAHPIHHTVKFVHVSGNAVAVGIEPGTRSYSVPGIYGISALGAEIGAPHEVALIDAFRQVLADGIGAFKSPQVAAVAGTRAGQEKGHRPRLQLSLSQARGK